MSPSLSLFHIAYIDQAYIPSPYFSLNGIYTRGRDNVAGANITFSAASSQRLLCDRAKVILRKRVCLHTRERKSISTISVLTMESIVFRESLLFLGQWWSQLIITLCGGRAPYYVGSARGGQDKISKKKRTRNILLFCFSSSGN